MSTTLWLQPSSQKHKKIQTWGAVNLISESPSGIRRSAEERQAK